MEASGKEQVQPEFRESGDSSDSSDGEDHRAVSAETESGFADDDPWAVPSSGGKAQPNQQETMDDDPWGAPSQPTPIAEASANSVKPPEHHHKHVAVPDISDDVDPWAMPLPAPSPTPSSENPSASQAASPTEQPNVRPRELAQQSQRQPQPTQPQVGQVDYSNDPWGAPTPVMAGPPEPEVAPEDDEYSMSDKSIGASDALDVNDLNRLFEVKKVEEFAADDPHNPRNMQVKKALDD